LFRVAAALAAAEAELLVLQEQMALRVQTITAQHTVALAVIMALDTEKGVTGPTHQTVLAHIIGPGILGKQVRYLYPGSNLHK
jgi:hypothetical protein